MKATTGIVYAKVSAALIVAGFAMIPLFAAVGAYETGSGIEVWIGVGAMSAFMLVMAIVIVRRPAPRGACVIQGPPIWRITKMWFSSHSVGGRAL